MQTVDMLQAKSSLSRLVETIEQGREREIIIARNGRPVAKLVPMDRVPSGKRIGVAKGLFEVPDSIDEHNDDEPVVQRRGAILNLLLDSHVTLWAITDIRPYSSGSGTLVEPMRLMAHDPLVAL